MTSENHDQILRLQREVRRLRAALRLATPPLDMVLRRRGFRVYRKEPPEDLLIPEDEHREQYYRMLHKYSFRLFLRDVIKHQHSFTIEQVTRFSTATVTGSYLSYLLSIGLVAPGKKAYALARGPIRSFGPTLEWYIAELMEREFSAESVWGIKFKRPLVGGDYDVISKLDGTIAYFEVKSSPPKQVHAEEIAAFLSRVDDLSPEIAVFFMDTELRMKDKIVPLFEQELGKRAGPPPEVVRIEKELFRVENRIFIINAKESIVGNIEKVLLPFWKK